MRKTLVLLSLFCFFVEVSGASAQDNTTQDGANLSDQSYQRSANKVYPIRSSNSEVAANKRDLVKKEKLKHRKEVNQLKVNQSRVGSEPVNKNHDLDHSSSNNSQSGLKHPEMGAEVGQQRPQQPMTNNRPQQPSVSGFNAGPGGRRP